MPLDPLDVLQNELNLDWLVPNQSLPLLDLVVQLHMNWVQHLYIGYPCRVQ